METKYCSTCEENRDIRRFHKRKASIDGLAARCKTCQRVYDKARAKDPMREEARRVYAQTEQGRERSNKAKAEYRERNPQKTKAHNAVSKAIRSGALKKEPCNVCGGNDGIQAHHDDYSDALNIIWLCPKHHALRHKRLNEINKKAKQAT